MKGWCVADSLSQTIMCDIATLQQAQNVIIRMSVNAKFMYKNYQPLYTFCSG